MAFLYSRETDFSVILKTGPRSIAEREISVLLPVLYYA